MQLASPPQFGLAENSPANLTSIGCLWIATFHLCFHTVSNHRRRPRRSHRHRSNELPKGIILTLEDSGDKLTLITMTDSNEETSSFNLTTFSEFLNARDDPEKISQMGRKIAESTMTAYLRKKVEQLYTLDMKLHHKKKFNYSSEVNLSRLLRPYFQPGSYQNKWTLALSYTILINFGFDGKAHVLFSNSHWDNSAIEPGSKECKTGEIYVNKKCRQVTCGEGYKFVDGFCRNTVGGGDTMYIPNPTDNTPVAEIDDDMTLIVLQANLTLSDYFATLIPEFKLMMVVSLSKLLKISPERIKNFTINIMDDKSEPKQVIIHKIPNKYFGMNMATNNRSGSIKSSFGSDFGINSGIEMKDENSDPNIPLEISFILVPLNNTSDGKSVSDIVRQMDDLVQNKEFTFNVNETSLTVIGLKNEQEPIILDSWCEHGMKRYYESDEFIMIDAENPIGPKQESKMIYINKTDSLYKTGEFDLTIFVHNSIGKDEPNITAFVFVCDSPRVKDKSCGRIVLESDEFEILQNNSLVFNQHMLSIEEYQILDNNMTAICIPSNKKSRRFWFHPDGCSNTNQNLFIAQSVLTLIFGVLSLFAMSAVLVTYILFPKLRNIPGINTMNLTISLFCAELIFLVFSSVDSDALCTWIAISLHYFFLSSFFWMNVMSFDLHCTFGHTNILPWPRSKRKVIPRYLLYAWGVPALIVGSCVAIDFSHVFPSVRIGYGSSDTGDTLRNVSKAVTGTNGTSSSLQDGGPRRLGCWIQDPLAALIAFGVPLICILLVNAVLFTRTISSIRKTIKTINLSLSNPASGRDDVVLYVRMSVVMGFTWILGLASSLISSGATPSYTICLLLDIVGLFFVIFNCSQGLFICFGFVMNRRVAGLYKDLWIDISKKLRPMKTVIAHISSDSRKE